MQVRIHKRADGSIARIDPPVRVEGSFAGLGLKCQECGRGVRSYQSTSLSASEAPSVKGGLHFWEFADGLFLLCYLCAARVLATCLSPDEDFGFELEDAS